MFETVASRMKKLERETKSVANNDELVFKVYLVKPKANGKLLRREWPDGKYEKIDPASLGIEPYERKEAPLPRAVVAPPVSIATPEPKPSMADDGEIDGADFARWFNSGLQ